MGKKPPERECEIRVDYLQISTWSVQFCEQFVIRMDALHILLIFLLISTTIVTAGMYSDTTEKRLESFVGSGWITEICTESSNFPNMYISHCCIGPTSVKNKITKDVQDVQPKINNKKLFRIYIFLYVIKVAYPLKLKELTRNVSQSRLSLPWGTSFDFEKDLSAKPKVYFGY